MDLSPATARPELVRRAHLTRWLHTPREPPSGGSTLLASDQMKRCSDPCAHSSRRAMELAPLTNQREEPPITGKAFELMRAAFIDANPEPATTRERSR